MPIRAPWPSGTLAGPRYELKTIVARHPRVAIPIERIRGRGEVTRDNTNVVIEAFPRSASSFAVAAFRLAQEPRATRIANHTHMPALVIDGVRRGISTLVLVREAQAAVVSLLIHDPRLPVRSALRGYLRFYEPLVAYRGGFTVGTFEQVTTDLGSVIRRLNDRSGSSFRAFHHTPENLARIEREIREDYGSRTRSERHLERTIPWPREARARIKEEVGERFRREAPPSLLRRADAVARALTT